MASEPSGVSQLTCPLLLTHPKLPFPPPLMASLLSGSAKRDVTVALTGDGADELFGGYDRYRIAASIWPWISRIPPPIRRSLGHLIRKAPVGLLDRFVSGANAFKLPVSLSGERLHKFADISAVENFLAELAGRVQVSRPHCPQGFSAVAPPIFLMFFPVLHQKIVTDFQMQNILSNAPHEFSEFPSFKRVFPGQL